jgi:hypothetical protein
MDKLHIDMTLYNKCLQTEDKAIKARSKSSMDKDLDLERSIGAIFHPSISINNHTFRGEYDDPNELFKAMCSTMIDRPAICQVKTIVNREEYTTKQVMDHNRDTYVKQETNRRYEEYDHTLQGMDRRARTAEIILGLVIVFILNCACISYCKMYNKKKSSD